MMQIAIGKPWLINASNYSDESGHLIPEQSVQSFYDDFLGCILGNPIGIPVLPLLQKPDISFFTNILPTRDSSK